MGRIAIRVPITESHFIELLFDVVDVQIPFLLGLETMKRFKLVLDSTIYGFHPRAKAGMFHLRTK